MQIAIIRDTRGKHLEEVVLETGKFDIYTNNRIGVRQGGGYLTCITDKVNSYECKELNNLPRDISFWCCIRFTKE